MEADERNLVPRAARGGQETFDEIVHAHQTGVFNVALRMLGNRQDAEDAAQDTFVRAFRSFHLYDPAYPPGPWLKKIAVNVCLNRLERKRDLYLDEEGGAFENDPAPGPAAHLETSELSARIRRELIRLPPRFRAAIELRHFQGLNYAEMAQALGQPLSNVKSDLFRARKLLAKLLQDIEPK
jgi:RNA polymerase sigma-70 factor (ECF subfamily)